MQSWASLTGLAKHPTVLPWRQAIFRTSLLTSGGESDLHQQSLLAIRFIVSMGLATLKNDMSRSPPNLDQESYEDWFYLWACGIEAFAVDSGVDHNRKREMFITEFCGSLDVERQLRLSLEQTSFSLMDLQQIFEEYFVLAEGMFATDRGYFGVCNKNPQLQDQVCILPSCNMGLIVRKVGNHYLLIDSCFVYGIMEGELAVEIEAGNLKFQDIVFR
jgi:hypothetical protein